MSNELGISLADFIRTHVATADEWEIWLGVQSAKPPDSQAIMPQGRDDDIRHVQLPASPEYAQREALSRSLVERARAKIAQGWEVSGRPGGSIARHVLEQEDVESLGFNLGASTIGSFRAIRVRRLRTSKTAALTTLIEQVCCETNPGDKLTKGVIALILKNTNSDVYSDNAFNAAWDEADIDDRWRKRGPR